MPMDSFQRLNRPPSLNETVQEAIRDFILQNQLTPGSALPPETELSKQLGVSRNSIREAVKALELVGLVEARRGSGLFVGEFSLDPLLDNLPFGLMNELTELRELLEIRHFLESSVVSRILKNRTPEQLTELETTLNDMQIQAEEGKAFPTQDRAFHHCLLRYAENQTLIKLSDIFWRTYQRASKISQIEDYDPITTYQNHRAIVEAIASGDEVQTQYALSQHYAGLGSLRFRIDKAQQHQTPSPDENRQTD